MAGTRADALRDSIVQESKRPGPAASAAPALTSIVAARSEQGLAATLGRLDSGSRARVAAGIQRTAGNAALQRALSPSSTSRVVVQRAPSDADPLWSLIDPAEQALHEQRIDQYISAVDRGVPWSDPMLGSLRTQINDYVTRKANAQISILNAKEAAKAAQAAEPFGGMGGGVRPGGGFYGQDVVADTVAGFPGGARPPADPFADTLPDALAETLPDALADTVPGGVANKTSAAAGGVEGASATLADVVRTGGAAVGVAAGAYQAYEGAKAASEAKSIEETILPGLNIGAGGATALGGIGVLAGSKSLAALGPAGWVLGAGIGGFAGGKWLADNALTPLMGIHEAGTTQTYTGSEADKLLHPDEESSGPGSVTETKSYAGKAADAILHPGTKSYEGDDAEADKKLHPENYSWYEKPWFGL